MFPACVYSLFLISFSSLRMRDDSCSGVGALKDRQEPPSPPEGGVGSRCLKSSSMLLCSLRFRPCNHPQSPITHHHLDTSSLDDSQQSTVELSEPTFMSRIFWKVSGLLSARSLMKVSTNTTAVSCGAITTCKHVEHRGQTQRGITTPSFTASHSDHPARGPRAGFKPQDALLVSWHVNQQDVN